MLSLSSQSLAGEVVTIQPDSVLVTPPAVQVQLPEPEVITQVVTKFVDRVVEVPVPYLVEVVKEVPVYVEVAPVVQVLEYAYVYQYQQPVRYQQATRYRRQAVSYQQPTQIQRQAPSVKLDVNVGDRGRRKSRDVKRDIYRDIDWDIDRNEVAERRGGIFRRRFL